VLKIDGKHVTKVGEIELGGLPDGVAFSPDGAYAYVGNFLDNDISIFKITEPKLATPAKRSNYLVIRRRRAECPSDDPPHSV
jgi:DNA-binding beta-propeller fold protein YncE